MKIYRVGRVRGVESPNFAATSPKKGSGNPTQFFGKTKRFHFISFHFDETRRERRKKKEERRKKGTNETE
jgi:hypothetical protein